MDEKFKILITTGIYPPDIGGPATYAVNLSREFEKIGCEVKIITHGNSRSKIKGVEVVEREQNLLSRYLKFFLLALKFSSWADIVYVLDLVSAGLPTTLAAKLKNKKIVFRTGGDFLWEKAIQKNWTEKPLFQYYNQKKGLIEKFYLFFCKLILKWINLILFSTTLQAEIYKKFYDLPQGKVKIIANAIFRRPDIVGSEENFGEYVIFAGRLIKLKNLERLIKATAELQNKDIKLIIFGQGPEKNKLEQLIKKLGAENSIFLRGHIDHSELISVISCSKFVVLPSITEISPNLALECLSMSKPFILTNQTGLDEELTKELITFDPLSTEDLKNKIEFLLEPKNLSEYAAKMKNIKIEERGWDKIALEHLSIFKNLLDG